MANKNKCPNCGHKPFVSHGITIKEDKTGEFELYFCGRCGHEWREDRKWLKPIE